MKAFITKLLLLVALFSFAGVQAFAVHVKGYTKKNGTYVAPHERTAPNKTKNDNYSTRGNVNPYTGKTGTKPRDEDYTAAQAQTAQPSENKSPGSNTEGSVRSKPKPGMTKTEVLGLLGEPSMKTETKWVYSDVGTVVFDSQGKTR